MVLNPFMHYVAKSPNILLKSCGVYTARFLKYVWPFSTLYMKALSLIKIPNGICMVKSCVYTRNSEIRLRTKIIVVIHSTKENLQTAFKLSFILYISSNSAWIFVWWKVNEPSIASKSENEVLQSSYTRLSTRSCS